MLRMMSGGAGGGSSRWYLSGYCAVNHLLTHQTVLTLAWISEAARGQGARQAARPVSAATPPPRAAPRASAASRVLVASSGLTAPRSPLCTGESLWAGSPREAHSSDLEGTGHPYPLRPGPRGRGLGHCLVSFPELVLGRAFLDVTTCTPSVCARPWAASGRLRGFEDFFLCLQNGDGVSPRVPGAWLSAGPATICLSLGYGGKTQCCICYLSHRSRTIRRHWIRSRYCAAIASTRDFLPPPISAPFQDTGAPAPSPTCHPLSYLPSL